MVVDLRLGYRPAWRTTLPWAALGVVMVALCMAFVDRPFATFSHDVIHRPRWCVWLTWIAMPAESVAAAILLAAVLWRLTRQRFDSVWRTAIAASAATLLALAAVLLLKFLCGRTWPETWVGNNPSWIANHTFRFSPLHAGPGYASFPSGHTARITAPFAVLWHRVPHWRPVWALPTSLVTVGLLGADFHFVSDCIAGGLLGVACALLMLRYV